MNLPSLSSTTIAVWGEPTLTQIAKCATPFQHDGAVHGSVSRHAGGSAYATAIGAAHLGARVVFHGPFASDGSGQYLLDTARTRGVEVRPVTTRVSRQTVIVVDTDGSRSMVSDLGDSFAQPHAAALEPIDAALLHVSLSSIVRDPTGSTEELCVRTSPFTPLSIDAGSSGVVRSWSDGRLARFIARTRPAVLFANEDEAAAVEQVLDPEHLAMISMLVIKHGSHPTEVRLAGETFHLPVQPVSAVVDTTGAGDAFAAGFLAHWVLHGGPVLDAVGAAHRYASRVIVKVGTLVEP